MLYKLASFFQSFEAIVDLLSGDIQSELGIKDTTLQVYGVVRNAADNYHHQVIRTPFKSDRTLLMIRYYSDEAA